MIGPRRIGQAVLPGVGAEGQRRLAAASVLVVGAGGLGCPVLLYLAGAGVGRLVIVDHDRVEESNLHRQPYRMDDVGSRKAPATRAALLRFNPEIEVEAAAERLTPDNAERLVADADVVIDAADSFAVTYILSDACRQASRPFVSASVVGLTGYVGAFCAAAPSYRAIFPDMPVAIANCATVGVLGAIVGVVGSLQAQFALHLILDLSPSPLGRLITFEAGRLAFGGFSFKDAPEPAGAVAPFIAPSAVTWDDVVVHLRSLAEMPISPFAGALRLGVEGIGAIADRGPPRGRVVLCCRSGVRAWRAARLLADRGLANMALVAVGDDPPSPTLRHRRAWAPPPGDAPRSDFGSEAPGRRPHDAAEMARHVALIAESDREGDLAIGSSLPTAMISVRGLARSSTRKVNSPQRGRTPARTPKPSASRMIPAAVRSVV